MKRIDEAYICLELGTARYPEDINNTAMEDILDEGIDCYPDDVYALVYEGYECDEEHLKMLLDEPDNSKNMWYPIDCFRDLSYDDWLDYKKEQDDEKERRRKLTEKIHKEV